MLFHMKDHLEIPSFTASDGGEGEWVVDGGGGIGGCRVVATSGQAQSRADSRAHVLQEGSQVLEGVPPGDMERTACLPVAAIDCASASLGCAASASVSAW